MYLHREEKEIGLLGDTSCDLTAEQAWQPIDNDTRHLTCLYGLFSFNQLVRESTRVTANSFSIIDHVATNCTNNIIKSGVHRISLSEHFIVYCVRKLNGTIGKSHKLIKARKMNRFNKLACLSDVASIGWDQLTTETDDINALDNHWTCIFSLIIEKHAPIVEKRVFDKYCPWVNKEQKNFARTRDKLKKISSEKQVCNCNEILQGSSQQSQFFE